MFGICCAAVPAAQIFFLMLNVHTFNCGVMKHLHKEI